MSHLHREVNFENEICEHLAANGWLYVQGDAANYDRTRTLFPEDVLAWVKDTQPKAWEALEKNHHWLATCCLVGCGIPSINAAR